MALDSEGSFSHANPRLVKRITPFGAKPALIVADGDAPIVVNADANLYYGHRLLDGRGVAVGLTQISPDGQQTLFSPDLARTLERREPTTACSDWPPDLMALFMSRPGTLS